MNDNGACQFQRSYSLKTRLIADIKGFDEKHKMKGRFVGIVVKIVKNQKFTTLLISDGTQTAQTTIVYQNIQPQIINAKVYSHVVVVGVAFQKQLGSNKKIYSILKIQAFTIGVITVDQYTKLMMQAFQTQRQFQQQIVQQKVMYLKPKYQSKKTFNSTQITDLRSVIFTYCYYVFEHNRDIQSYVFNSQMIRYSSQGKDAMQTYKITSNSFEEAITQQLIQLCVIGILKDKTIEQHQKKQKFYTIKRDFLTGIQKSILQSIRESGNSGTNIQQVTKLTNIKLSKFYNVLYTLIDYKFAQKVLAKLQSQNIIYKDSQKRIFPNLL